MRCCLFFLCTSHIFLHMVTCILKYKLISLFYVVNLPFILVISEKWRKLYSFIIALSLFSHSRTFLSSKTSFVLVSFFCLLTCFMLVFLLEEKFIKRILGRTRLKPQTIIFQLYLISYIGQIMNSFETSVPQVKLTCFIVVMMN